MLKAYKIEIKPTEEQKVKINKTIGVCRFIYNFYISKNIDEWGINKTFISAYSFSKWMNNDFVPNNPSYSWIKDVSSKSVKQSTINAEKSFKRFFKGQSKFPRYKKKSDTSVKMYLPKNNRTDWTIERHRVKIPTLGFVRLKEFGYIPIDSKVKSGTVSIVADRYYVSILVDEDVNYIIDKTKSSPVGVDIGIKEFAFISNGEKFKNINKTNKVKRLEKKLKREQRAMSRKLENKEKRRANENSTNLNKNKIRVQKLHGKLSRIRKEYVKFVVNSLVKNNPKFIAIEDLNISGMIKNRCLSNAIRSQNFYYFREYLISKCSKLGIEVRIIDRWFPSSKTCNQCGSIKKDLKLSDRMYKCECGHVEDRDLNASKNIRDCGIYKIAN